MDNCKNNSCFPYENSMNGYNRWPSRPQNNFGCGRMEKPQMPGCNMGNNCGCAQNGGRFDNTTAPACGCGQCGNRNMQREKNQGSCQKSCCENNYGCPCIEEMPIAMAYVPCQQWRGVCSGAEGIRQGTIFEDLVKPFVNTRCNCNCGGVK